MSRENKCWINMKTKLPNMFKPLLWSYRFNAMDIKEHKRTIIIQTVNFGSWRHWQWLFSVYGKKQLKKIIENTPASEFTFFHPSALKLICVLLGIKQLKYASRIDLILGKKNPLPVEKIALAR